MVSPRSDSIPNEANCPVHLEILALLLRSDDATKQALTGEGSGLGAAGSAIRNPRAEAACRPAMWNCRFRRAARGTHRGKNRSRERNWSGRTSRADILLCVHFLGTGGLCKGSLL